MIVIFLADKLAVIHHVELLPRHKLLPTYEAGEALEMEDFVPGLPHQVTGGDTTPAPATLRTKPPEEQ